MSVPRPCSNSDPDTDAKQSAVQHRVEIQNSTTVATASDNDLETTVGAEFVITLQSIDPKAMRMSLRSPR
jgi:hypothetical protein